MVGGHVDHVHVLCHITKKHSVVDLIEELKTSSSKFAKTIDPSMSAFTWQTGYAIFGVSHEHFNTVRYYIHGQDEHHKKVSFQDEFRTLMRESGIEFDERYVWD